MTLISLRSYRILSWGMPLLVLFIARDLLWTECSAIYSHVVNIQAGSERIRKTGVDVRELPEMKSDYEQLAREKMKIASSLFGAKAQTGLYDLLMQKAGEASVSIVAVAPKPQKTEAGFVELPLALEVTGSFDSIALFVNVIEKVNRLMRVEDLAVAKDQTGRLSAGIRLLAYLYSDTLGPSGTGKGKKDAVYRKREEYLADLHKALEVQIAPASFSYTPGGHGDPFGATLLSGTKMPGPVAAPSASKQPFGLTLKGILWKNPPLAILETLDGQTNIVQEGETVSGFKVSSISRTDVTIATPQGNHVLHQYDEK
jgi:Tfp pilus assembly protein PilO